MEKCLKNKICIVTGGAEGIGLDIAKKFLKRGAKLTILLDINEEKGNEAVTEITSTIGPGKAVFIKCDVTKDLERVFEEVTSKYRSIDVLVNNAGVGNEAAYKRTIDINLTAAIDWSLRFGEHMKRGCTIINISSIFGIRITPTFPVYHATKYGLAAFSRSYGHKYRYEKRGVRVVTLCPGMTKTSLTDISKVDNEDFVKIIQNHEWQEVGVVGDAAADVFEKAESGSVWVIEGGKLTEQNL